MKLTSAKNHNSSTWEQLLLVLVLVSIAGLFVFNNVLWRWDNLLYDAQLSFWTRHVSDDIVIIAIDDQSLNDLGHWPWPRSTHAELINKLDRESPRAIGLDIIFSEADANNPESDRLLSEAIQNSGKVVLPVFMAQKSINSYPIEALPLPEFTQHAAQLGHVHVDISKDGIARKIYLKEGIEEPQWMHYSLALLSITDAAIKLKNNAKEKLPGQSYSSMRWSREHPFLIPYAGPPGHFQHIGYSQVLSGQYPKNFFHNKIVLIGTTAEGMGDSLPTPLSGKSGTMSGVEIIANVIDALMSDKNITELNSIGVILITLLLVALPALAYPYLNPASTLAVLFGMMSITIIIDALSLWMFGLWIPASTILLFQFLSYPLWSWRRLVLAMRHLNLELDQLLSRQQESSLHRERNLPNEIEFLASFIPLDGWLLFDEKGSRLAHNGHVPSKTREALKLNCWQFNKDQCWVSFQYQNQICRLGLRLQPETHLSDKDKSLLNNLIRPPRQVHAPQARYLEDVLQRRISQVQTVGSEYQALRRIVDDSLSGMADGVLICDGHGQVMLSNRRMGWYMYGDDDATINGKSLTRILQQLKIKDNSNWSTLLQQVIFDQQRVLTEAQHSSGRHLMIEISPLSIIGDELEGFVLNFSDISRLKLIERKRNDVLNFISHDLRSPLSSTIAMIELAKNKNSLNEVHQMLDNIENNTYKTLHLAEQFLQLSRANANEPIEFYDIDFNSIVLNAIDQLWALSDKLNILIIHEFEHEELWTQAEPDLLERTIVNLLSNALRHSKPHKPVLVTVKLIDNEIVCCVIDQGSGIAEDDQPHLFEMFRRSRKMGSKQKQGIGLGLAFVDAVARRHSGKIDIESKLGQGSTFCLKIPRVDTVEQ